MDVKLTPWLQAMTQHINSCLTWELARVNVTTHIVRQILRGKDLLTLLHCVFRLIVQVGLENHATCSITWAICKGLSLWVVLIYSWHLAGVWLWLVWWQSLGCVARSWITSVIWSKLRVWLSVSFAMRSAVPSLRIIHWRASNQVLGAFFSCHCLVHIAGRRCLHNVVVLYGPKI